MKKKIAKFCFILSLSTGMWFIFYSAFWYMKTQLLGSSLGYWLIGFIIMLVAIFCDYKSE